MLALTLHLICFMRKAHRVFTHIISAQYVLSLEEIELELKGLLSFLETCNGEEFNHSESLSLILSNKSMAWKKRLFECCKILESFRNDFLVESPIEIEDPHIYSSYKITFNEFYLDLLLIFNSESFIDKVFEEQKITQHSIFQSLCFAQDYTNRGFENMDFLEITIYLLKENKLKPSFEFWPDHLSPKKLIKQITFVDLAGKNTLRVGYHTFKIGIFKQNPYLEVDGVLKYKGDRNSEVLKYANSMLIPSSYWGNLWRGNSDSEVMGFAHYKIKDMHKPISFYVPTLKVTALFDEKTSSEIKTRIREYNAAQCANRANYRFKSSKLIF